MFDVAEHPWALLILATLVFLIIGTLRSIYPEKRRFWHTLLPLAIAAAGIGIDAWWTTDREAVRVVVDTLLEATENEDIPALAALIGPEYQDSYHRSRGRLMDRIERELSSPLVRSIRRNGQAALEFPSPTTAKALVRMAVRFEPESRVARTYGPGYTVLVRFGLEKAPDDRWRVDSIEILEVNMQPVSWNKIPSLS